MRPFQEMIYWKGVPTQLCGNSLSALFSFILIISPESGKIKKKPKQLLSTKTKNRCLEGPREERNLEVAASLLKLCRFHWGSWDEGLELVRDISYPSLWKRSKDASGQWWVVVENEGAAAEPKLQIAWPFQPSWRWVDSGCGFAAVVVVWLHHLLLL